VTLNDPVYVEAAQGLARRVAGTDASTSAKAARAFRLCLTRPPGDNEVAALVRLYDDAKADYEQHPDDATKLATDPLGPLPEGANPAEYAAWTVVANVLLNLDEALAKP
jgi:hypothetical protein